MNQSLLTVKELSSFLHVHPNTIYKWTGEGKIPFVRIGNLIRFSRQEIERWQATYKNNTQELSEILPKFDLSLENYDRILLKRRTELKGQITWTYGIGSVILRKTKNKEERFYIHYQVDKHRVRKVVKGARTKAEAIKVLNSEIADALRGKYNFKKHNSEITFHDMADIYLEKYAKPKKRSWKSTDRVFIRNMKPFFSDIKLIKITPLMVEDYKIERLENGSGRREGEKVSNSTINRELQCLRKIFNKAIDWGYATDNPVRKVDFLSEKGNIRKRVLNEDEEKRFKAAVPFYLKQMILVALHTGMRKGEVLKLKWENVDFERREITIVETKDDEDRVVPMNPLLFNLLLMLKSQDGKGEYVFTNPTTGKRYVEIKRAFTSACKKACIDDFHFHDLRHTYASRLVRNGADLNTVKELLGHSSITTTQRYLHSQAEQKRIAVNTLSGQAKEIDLQWQMSDKSPLENAEAEVVTPSILSN